MTTTNERPHLIAAMIRGYFRKTQREEYTDVGDVWEIFDEIHKLDCGESLQDWLDRCPVQEPQ